MFWQNSEASAVLSFDMILKLIQIDVFFSLLEQQRKLFIKISAI